MRSHKYLLSVVVEGCWASSSEVRRKGDDKTDEDCPGKDFGDGVSILFYAVKLVMGRALQNKQINTLSSSRSSAKCVASRNMVIT